MWTAPRCPSRARPSLVGAFNVGVGSSDLGFAIMRNCSSRLRRADRIGDRALVIASSSLRRRGDEIRVTAARSQRVPSIDFLSAAGRALPSRLPDTDFARRCRERRHWSVSLTVAHNRDDVIAITSLRRRGDEIRVTAARSQRVPSIDFLSARGEHFLRTRLPDADFALGWFEHCRP